MGRLKYFFWQLGLFVACLACLFVMGAGIPPFLLFLFVGAVIVTIIVTNILRMIDIGWMSLVYAAASISLGYFVFRDPQIGGLLWSLVLTFVPGKR